MTKVVEDILTQRTTPCQAHLVHACTVTSLVPRPFFFQLLNVRGRGKKRPGIHCTGDSARALNC